MNSLVLRVFFFIFIFFLLLVLLIPINSAPIHISKPVRWIVILFVYLYLYMHSFYLMCAIMTFCVYRQKFYFSFMKCNRDEFDSQRPEYVICNRWTRPTLSGESFFYHWFNWLVCLFIFLSSIHVVVTDDITRFCL